MMFAVSISGVNLRINPEANIVTILIYIIQSNIRGEFSKFVELGV